MTVAIIGAGIAGLSAAKSLAERGVSVILFDKGRGAGGRLSTRRVDTGQDQLRFDHGAQYFTVTGAAFGEAVAVWRDAGHVEPWSGQLVDIGEAGGIRPRPAKARYVGVPGMNALVKAQASDLEVRWTSRVARLLEDPAGIRIEFADGASGGAFEKVIVATPAEQAVELLSSVAGDLADYARSVPSDPCWTVMCHFRASVPVSWDGARVNRGPLAWVARDASKPGRRSAGTWILQATSDWSVRHIDADPDDVGETLVSAFRSLTGAQRPDFIQAHRWLYARPKPAQRMGPLWRDDFRVGACGDWCEDGRIEGAWMSGRSLIQALDVSV